MENNIEKLKTPPNHDDIKRKIEREKNEAAIDVAKELEELSKAKEKPSYFEAKGRKYEIKTQTDALIAGIQSDLESTGLLADKYGKENNHRKESAARKLEEALKSFEQFVMSYADLKTSDFNEVTKLFEERYRDLGIKEMCD